MSATEIAVLSRERKAIPGRFEGKAAVVTGGTSGIGLSIVEELLKEGCKVTPNDIMDALEAENIESRPIWKPMNLQPVFAECDFFSHHDKGISVGEDIFNRGVCMPSDIKNTPEDMELIIKTVRKLFE